MIFFFVDCLPVWSAGDQGFEVFLYVVKFIGQVVFFDVFS